MRMRQPRMLTHNVKPWVIPLHILALMDQTWTEQSVLAYWTEHQLDWPRRLFRPPTPSVSQAMIAAIEPDLGKIPIATLIKGLQLNRAEYK